MNLLAAGIEFWNIVGFSVIFCFVLLEKIIYFEYVLFSLDPIMLKLVTELHETFT